MRLITDTRTHTKYYGIFGIDLKSFVIEKCSFFQGPKAEKGERGPPGEPGIPVSILTIINNLNANLSSKYLQFFLYHYNPIKYFYYSMPLILY